jgi:transcription elongation factor SPT6
VHSHLVPSAQTWARNYLQEEEEEFVGNICRLKLRQVRCFDSSPEDKADPLFDSQRINVAPYRREDGTMEKGDTPSVLALSHGRGDPQRDDVTYCYIDSDGHFRENGTISNLFSPNETEREQFVDLLKRRRPQAVVIGGFSPATKRLMADFRSFAQGVTDSIVAEEEADIPGDEDEKITPDERHRRAVFDAIYVYDDVAKIYMNSQRAQLEFPDLTRIAKYCIGLARYAQSPINEYAALGPDLTALTYDPNQKFVSRLPFPPRSTRAELTLASLLTASRPEARSSSREGPHRGRQPSRRRHQ